MILKVIITVIYVIGLSVAFSKTKQTYGEKAWWQLFIFALLEAIFVSTLNLM